MNRIQMKYKALYYVYQVLVPFRGRYWWFKSGSQYGLLLQCGKETRTSASAQKLLMTTFGAFIPSEVYVQATKKDNKNTCKWTYLAPSDLVNPNAIVEPKTPLDALYLIGIKFTMSDHWRSKVSFTSKENSP